MLLPKRNTPIFPRTDLHSHSNPPRAFLSSPCDLPISERRAAHRFGSSDAGSVGSQTLTGIPRLHELRFAPEFAPRSAVWPFETGWATKANWLGQGVSIVHAEIYPSVREPLADAIKDRGQVRSMWEWTCELDRQDLFWFEFARPVKIDPGSPEDIAIQLAEGWILGCSPTARHQ